MEERKKERNASKRINAVYVYIAYIVHGRPLFFQLSGSRYRVPLHHNYTGPS